MNLDVNKLFEQNSISEVEVVNRKIQDEVERKKEELRTMVGERYRDLLMAADTIAEMKKTSAKIENVTRLKDYSEKISQQNLFNENKCPKNALINNSFYGIIAQIKILTILIEMISSLIDEKDYLAATQLFIFARHIFTALKLDGNSDIMRKFPVARKQWDMLAPFYHVIKVQCLQELEKECVNVNESAKCLASLLILENIHLKKLLSIFIRTRINAYISIIQNGNYATVKDKLLASVKILINTAEIIHECFVENNGGDGLIKREIKKITDEKSSPTLNIVLCQHNSSIFQTLPDIISRHKPQIQLIELDKVSMNTSMAEWLQSIENNAQNELKELIKCIVSIKTIQDIKNHVYNIEKPKKWSYICKTLFECEDFDFYYKFYQPKMFHRMHKIIEISWSNIQSEFVTELEKFIEDSDQSVQDLKKYVWTEDIADNPLSLKDALSLNPRSHKLLMKVNGYSPLVVNLCDKIDSNLELLFNDLKQYMLGTSKVVEFRKIDESDLEDHKKLVLFLRECSRNNISSLITFIKSSSLIKTSDDCLIMARLLQSLTEICPNLKLCFSGQLIEPISFTTNASDPTKDESQEEWIKISNLLVEESVNFWQTWLDTFFKDWNELDSNIDLQRILVDFPNWDSIAIEEKDESDNIIESQIHVPQQLSISIQCWIFDIIKRLNRIIPHTLPKIIHSHIIDQLCLKLYNHYESLTKQDFDTNNQIVAWQMLFDLKVIIMMFLRRENKTVNENFNQLVNHFRNIIDPFDFDVFYKYVNENIKKNVAKLQYEMGCLIPNMEYLTSVLANQNLQATHDKEPNILVMTQPLTDKNWFPLLPIIATKEQLIAVDTEKDKKKATKPKQSSTGAISKKPVMHVSASTSALSSLQDWFR